MLINVDTEQPFVAFTAASETEIPEGKFIHILPPAIIFEEVVNVNVYSVFGFDAAVLLIAMNVEVIMLGVMTKIEVLLTWSTK